MTSSLPILYTSRSPANLYNKCNRARFLNYHLLSTGVEKDSLYLPFVVGGAVHKGMEELLKKFIGYEGLPSIGDDTFHSWVREAVQAAKKEFLSRVEGSSYDLAEVDQALAQRSDEQFSHIPSMSGARDERAEYILYLTNEQLCLVESMVAGYAFAETGLRALLRSYEILEVEQEDSFPLHQGSDFELWWEARADGLLRHRVDDALVVLSFKTASRVDDRTQAAAESDVQGMSEVIAVERRLGMWSDEVLRAVESDGKLQFDIPDWFITSPTTKVEGVQMIHLIKGAQKKDSQGFDRQENPIIRPWVKRGNFDEGDDYRFVYKWKSVGPRGGEKWETLGGSYARVNLWEEAQRLQCEVWELIYAFSQAKDDEIGMSPLEKWISFPSISRREPWAQERWLKEVTAQEKRIARGLVQIRSLTEMQNVNISEALNEIVAEIFPHTGSSTGACAYWSGAHRASKCSFFDMCWGSRYYSEDPLNSGFKRRTPNHPGELVQIESLLSNQT